MFLSALEGETMQELRRVLLDKRFIIVLFLILSLNGILFYSYLKPEEEAESYMVEQYGENYRADFKETKEKLYEEYSRLDLQTAIAKLQEKSDAYVAEEQAFMDKALPEWDGSGELPSYQDSLSNEENIKRVVLNELYGGYIYVHGYQDYVAKILQRADIQMEDENIFVRDSFAGRNIVKTKADFEKIQKVTPEYGPQDAFNAVSDYNLSDFIMIILVATGVIIMIDERKKGLWEFVYSMPGGRRKLAAKRVVIMAVVAGISASTLYLENIVMSGLYHTGYGDVLRPIQSMEICNKVTMNINVLEFLCLSLFWKFVVVFLLGVLVLTLVLSLKGHVQVLFLTAFFLVAEYMGYINIDVHSRFNILKYVNIFAWLDAEWCMRNYLNLNVFDHPVSIYTMMTVMSVVLLAVSCGLMVYLGRVRPFAIRDGFLRKLFAKITVRVKIYRHENMFATELYKQFLVQRMWVLVALAILLSFWRYDSGEVYYDYSGTLYNAYMEKLSGPVTMQKKEYLENEIVVWQEKYDEQAAILGTDISESLRKSTEAKMKQFQIAIDCTTALLEYTDTQLEYSENGENAQLVNNTGYNHYMGENSSERNNLDGLIILTLVTVMASVLFASENALNSREIIGSTKNGRGKFRRCKYGVLLVEEILVCLPVMTSTLTGIQAKYHLMNGDASIHSLTFAEQFPFAINIIGVMILVAFLTILILYAIAVAATLVSQKMNNVMASVIVNMLIFVMPAALFYIGFEKLSLFTVLNEIVVSGWIFH